MKKKSYAVIGMGKFGKSVALALSELGAEVIAVDNNAEKIQDVADLVSYAAEADVTDPEALKKVGIGNADVVIIGIADNMEASIITTIYAKEQGVPYVLTKAMNHLHGEILKKIGADEVIFPEAETGMRLAKNLVSGRFEDFYELTADYSMAEMLVPQGWIGKSILELKVREIHQVNVVGIKEDKKVIINPDPKMRLDEGMEVILIGENQKLSQLKSGR
ncbi:MAG: potassium channel family protein [Lachnospiraceae bacterium]|jgi:trk system potassium uptake protein TrkA